MQLYGLCWKRSNDNSEYPKIDSVDSTKRRCISNEPNCAGSVVKSHKGNGQIFKNARTALKSPTTNTPNCCIYYRDPGCFNYENNSTIHSSNDVHHMVVEDNGHLLQSNNNPRLSSENSYSSSQQRCKNGKKREATNRFLFKNDSNNTFKGRAIINLAKTEENVNFGISISNCYKDKIIVTGLKPGSPAYRNDILEKGDLILNVNGQKIGKSIPRSIENLLGHNRNHIQLEIEYTLPSSNNAIFSTGGNLEDANKNSHWGGGGKRNVCGTFFVKQFRIKLRKDDKSSNFGFIVRGGRQPIYSNSLPFLVTSIRPGGPADRDGSIKPGDRLLYIDNLNLDNATLTEVVSLIRHYNTEAIFTFAYDTMFYDDMLENQIIYVRFEKPVGTSIGIGVFPQNSKPVNNDILLSKTTDESDSANLTKWPPKSSLKSYLQIKRIKTASIADRCGILNANDLIVSIDGISTRGMCPAEVLKLIKYNINPAKPTRRQYAIKLGILKNGNNLTEDHQKLKMANGYCKNLKTPAILQHNYEVCDDSLVDFGHKRDDRSNNNLSSTDNTTSPEISENYSTSLKSCGTITNGGTESSSHSADEVAVISSKSKPINANNTKLANGCIDTTTQETKIRLNYNHQTDSSADTLPSGQNYQKLSSPPPSINRHVVPKRGNGLQISRRERVDLNVKFGPKGIGIALQDKITIINGHEKHRTCVSNVEPDSVAEKIGLIHSGDVIIEVNHFNVEGLSAQKVADLIKNSKASCLASTTTTSITNNTYPLDSFYIKPFDVRFTEKATDYTGLKHSKGNSQLGTGDCKNDADFRFCQLKIEYEITETCKTSTGTFSIQLPKSGHADLGVRFASNYDPLTKISQLIIQEIVKGSIAERSGILKKGDTITKINNFPVKGMNVLNAMVLIEKSRNIVKLEISKGKIDDWRKDGGRSYHISNFATANEVGNSMSKGLSKTLRIISTMENDLLLNSTALSDFVTADDIFHAGQQTIAHPAKKTLGNEHTNYAINGRQNNTREDEKFQDLRRRPENFNCHSEIAAFGRKRSNQDTEDLPLNRQFEEAKILACENILIPTRFTQHRNLPYFSSLRASDSETCENLRSTIQHDKFNSEVLERRVIPFPALHDFKRLTSNVAEEQRYKNHHLPIYEDSLMKYPSIPTNIKNREIKLSDNNVRQAEKRERRQGFILVENKNNLAGRQPLENISLYNSARPDSEQGPYQNAFNNVTSYRNGKHSLNDDVRTEIVEGGGKYFHGDCCQCCRIPPALITTNDQDRFFNSNANLMNRRENSETINCNNNNSFKSDFRFNQCPNLFSSPKYNFFPNVNYNTNHLLNPLNKAQTEKNIPIDHNNTNNNLSNTATGELQIIPIDDNSNNDTPVQSVDSAVESLDSSGADANSQNIQKRNQECSPFCVNSYNNWMIHHPLQSRIPVYIDSSSNDKSNIDKIYSKPHQNRNVIPKNATLTSINKNQNGLYSTPTYFESVKPYVQYGCISNNNHPGGVNGNGNLNGIGEEKCMIGKYWLQDIENRLSDLNIKTPLITSIDENNKLIKFTTTSIERSNYTIENGLNSLKNPTIIGVENDLLNKFANSSCRRTSSLKSVQLDGVKVKHLNRLLNLSQSRINDINHSSFDGNKIQEKENNK